MSPSPEHTSQIAVRALGHAGSSPLRRQREGVKREAARDGSPAAYLLLARCFSECGRVQGYQQTPASLAVGKSRHSKLRPGHGKVLGMETVSGRRKHTSGELAKGVKHEQRVY